MSKLTRGLAAGAAGTTLLNAVTYADMALRGRPESSIPAAAAGKLAERLGLPLGEGEAAEARRSGIGAVLGLLTGCAGGAAWALTHPVTRRLPRPAAAALAGLGIMAATDSGNVALGLTDPRTWSASDWLSDLVPHLAYGAGVVMTLDALAD
jgi:hypothetical protein